jgi:hypothetical protein
VPVLGDDLDPERWEALAAAKEESWLRRHAEGPAAQLRAMDAPRASVRAIRGPVTDEERAEDLAHHVAMAALLRRADRR